VTAARDSELRDARDDRERARAMVFVADALWMVVEAFLRGDASVNRLRGAMLRYDDARQKCDLTWPTCLSASVDESER
jgi:hypothetical protein